MKCFFYALRGLGNTIKNERNMRVHLCFAFYVICAGLVCGISAAQWTAVLICVGLVTALECLNTALESLCDAFCTEKNRGIKLAKDAAAGAVLCAAASSAVVGGIIFFRADCINAALVFLKNHSAAAVTVILLLIPAALFIAAPRQIKQKNGEGNDK